MAQTTFAEDVRELPMKWVWGVAVVVAGVVVGVFEPAQALEDVIANKGLTEEQINAAAFIFGYTLPFTVATAVVVFGAIHGWFSSMTGPWSVVSVALIFLVAGYFSKTWGLGLAPADTYQQVHGNPFFAVPINVFLSYFTSYGLPLMVAGLALGCAAGLHLHHLVPHESTPSAD